MLEKGNRPTAIKLFSEMLINSLQIKDRPILMKRLQSNRIRIYSVLESGERWPSG
jgi:hypothetical protein